MAGTVVQSTVFQCGRFTATLVKSEMKLSLTVTMTTSRLL